MCIVFWYHNVYCPLACVCIYVTLITCCYSAWMHWDGGLIWLPISLFVWLLHLVICCFITHCILVVLCWFVCLNLALYLGTWILFTLWPLWHGMYISSCTLMLCFSTLASIMFWSLMIMLSWLIASFALEPEILVDAMYMLPWVLLCVYMYIHTCMCACFFHFELLTCFDSLCCSWVCLIHLALLCVPSAVTWPH